MVDLSCERGSTRILGQTHAGCGEDLGEVEVGGNLKGIVKDKVVEFETLARNSTLESNPRVACHVSADPDTCPQSLKQTNSGSKAPFRV